MLHTCVLVLIGEKQAFFWTNRIRSGWQDMLINFTSIKVKCFPRQSIRMKPFNQHMHKTYC